MTRVISCAQLGRVPLVTLLARYGMRLDWLPPGSEIAGSFWGGSEAGLIGNALLVRDDTPVHSALHEAGHFICMDPARRAGLHTDAGSDDLEEVAVCYLQVVLADHLPGYDRRQLLLDMDAWGYSFRLGSSRAWFEQDAGDARNWLRRHGLIDARNQPTWQLRQD